LPRRTGVFVRDGGSRISTPMSYQARDVRVVRPVRPGG
jgi:hypothetical protein